MNSYNMNEIAQTMDILFITLDSLRFDVADSLFKKGLTPHFQQFCPEGWQKSHAPGSFTFASHQAFFAGFLPTPAIAGRHARLFAAKFAGSETTNDNTLVFDTANIVAGFKEKGFLTACVGGVGFFNRKTALGTVLPDLFDESYWDETFGVTEKYSTFYQFEKAVEIIKTAKQQPLFLFINVSAIHQPNWFYLAEADDSKKDSLASHAAALQYVDSQLLTLFSALRKKRDTFCIICSDHGTAYGEDDFWGHRIAHPTVWEVPMATFICKYENITN